MEKVMLAYSGNKIDSVEICYTTYKSPLIQEVKFAPLLPAEIKSEEKFPIVNYEPSPEEVFNGLMSQYLSGLFLAAVIDSFAAEQAARRNAMENATDNAEEMFAQLSLSYNRARQASITQEITEIIGGSSVNS
jgi:F-type H+-transporting ATPase subunit gamma